MRTVCINGKYAAADGPVLPANNKSFRYGDGLFETMKVYRGQILLFALHTQRLFESLALLQYKIPVHFTAEKIETEILALCRKNNCEQLARVRLSIWRGNGGLYEESSLEYLIECWPLPATLNQLNENGLIIGVYPDAKKSVDKFANIKSANFLPYVMAAHFAKENKWNDCLLLNHHDRIADSTIANLFLVKDNIISTPALPEGCVNGTMRKYLLQQLPQQGFTIRETTISLKDLEEAGEVFLTNAVHCLRWVERYGDKTYTKITTKVIYEKTVQPFYT